MRHIVAGALRGVLGPRFARRLCAWRARGSAAARPPFPPSPLRGSLFAARASRAYCYLNVDVNATYCRRAAARLPLRASRSGCAPLRGAWLALLRSLSLLAASRLAGLPSCSAVALPSVPAARAVDREPLLRLPPAPLRGARSAVRRCCGARPRCAGRRPVSPLLRLAVGLRARHSSPCPVSTSVLVMPRI